MHSYNKGVPLPYQSIGKMDLELLNVSQTIMKSDDIENEKRALCNLENMDIKRFTDIQDIREPMQKVDINNLISVKCIKKEPIDGQMVIENDAFIAYIQQIEDVNTEGDTFTGGVAIKKEPLEEVDFVVEIEVLLKHESVKQKESKAAENVTIEETEDAVLTNGCLDSGITPFECNICLRRYIRKGNLYRHFRTHTTGESFMCEICQQTFSAQHTLDIHIRAHVGEMLYKSEKICQPSYTQKIKLGRHFRLGTVKKHFRCHICRKKCHTLNYLHRHLKIHSGKKLYVCKICERSYSQKRKFDVHIKLHTAKKPFNCYLCPKRFRAPSYLVRHIRTHTGEKPFKCDICEKCFSQQQSLSRHYQIHTEGKRYKCEICQKRFSYRDYFVKHLSSHSTKIYQNHVQCFSKTTPLTTDLAKCPDEKYFECGYCQRKFAAKCNLARHMIIHIEAY